MRAYLGGKSINTPLLLLAFHIDFVVIDTASWRNEVICPSVSGVVFVIVIVRAYVAGFGWLTSEIVKVGTTCHGAKYRVRRVILRGYWSELGHSTVLEEGTSPALLDSQLLARCGRLW